MSLPLIASFFYIGLEAVIEVRSGRTMLYLDLSMGYQCCLPSGNYWSQRYYSRINHSLNCNDCIPPTLLCLIIIIINFFFFFTFWTKHLQASSAFFGRWTFKTSGYNLFKQTMFASLICYQNLPDRLLWMGTKASLFASLRHSSPLTFCEKQKEIKRLHQPTYNC